MVTTYLAVRKFEMFSRRARFISFSTLLNDAVATAAAFSVAYVLRVWLVQVEWHRFRPIYPFRSYIPVLLIAVITFPAVGYLLGAYDRLEFRRPREMASDVVRMVILGMLGLLAVLFVSKGDYVSRGLLLAFAFSEFVILASSRWLLFVHSSWIHARPDRHKNFVIVGTTPGAAEVASLLEAGERFGFHLLAFVYTGDKPPEPPSGLKREYAIVPREHLTELLHRHVVDEVVFAVEKDDLFGLEPLLHQCEEEGVHMRLQLDFLPKGFSQIFVEHLAHVPLLTFASSPQNEFALFFKRAIDVIFSAVALAIFSPVLLLLALLIKLTSSGPVFYRQVRCGLGGRRFVLLKFRSMVENAEQLQPSFEEMNEVDGPVFKIRNDPRCTTIGRWMRVLSLDELPQLWNVLRGDMSLVGPRPPLPQEVEQYEPWQRRRLRIRPGLTCLWALEGRSQLQFERWVKLDLLYIDNWSMWLDLKILLKTIPAVLSGKGAH